MVQAKLDSRHPELRKSHGVEWKKTHG